VTAWLLRVAAIVLLGLVLLAVAGARLRGTAVVLASGEAVGYSQQSGEWLFAEYPSTPLRRDGPYVLYDGSRREALTLQPQADGKIRLVHTRAGDAVEVVADGAPDIRFHVPLRDHHPRSPVQWPMPQKLLAVSDLEGEFAAAVRLLGAQGVIGERLEWTYGNGHVVLIGDMVDRGIDVVPLLWLIYKLEAEAEAAGGAVHYVLGNHERYLLQGRAKSAHPKYLATARATGRKHGELWSERSELGRWLRSKPVMIKVGDTVFAHGGVSRKVLALAPDLADIDAVAARCVAETTRCGGAVMRHTGPTSDRTLAKANEADAAANAHLARVLHHFGAQRIAIGHTRVNQVGHTHGGRVLRTDVAHARGMNEAILWRDARWWRVDDHGNRVPLDAIANRTD